MINQMMNSYICMYGIDEAIKWLIELGFRTVELVEIFRFEEDDVARIAKEMEEE